MIAKYGITSEVLVDSWVAFSTTRCQGDSPNLDTLRVFDIEVLSKEVSGGSRPDKEPLDDSLVIHNITTINQM